MQPRTTSSQKRGSQDYGKSGSLLFDMADFGSVQRFVERAHTTLGRLNGAILIAGINDVRAWGYFAPIAEEDHKTSASTPRHTSNSLRPTMSTGSDGAHRTSTTVEPEVPKMSGREMSHALQGACPTA
ncbi:hypothetical protein B0H13DRAFT_1907267 [Mycena leptocephala]|nr:hypothetical protein B0H13DRAFT_1907267 [Mycena leptocephala]